MSTTDDSDIPYLDSLWEREDGEWSWGMLAASVTIPIIPAGLLLGLSETVGFVLYAMLVFWTGIGGSWRDTAGKGLYATGVVFALLPILAAGSVLGETTTGAGAAGAALGATLALPIFVTLGAVTIGIGYYLR